MTRDHVEEESKARDTAVKGAPSGVDDALREKAKRGEPLAQSEGQQSK